MANMEESSPFLPSQKSDPNNEMKPIKPSSSSIAGPVKPNTSSAVPMGWTADGLPMGHSGGPTVVGEPIVHRAQWESGLCSCFGKNDEFVSSDFEVCLLGTLAPCVLYGSNAERIGSSPGSFANHCLPYLGLYLIGQSFFGWNCMAPWFSYPSRTAIRQRFNLEGNCEAATRSCGCYGGFVEDEERREQCESTCDFATHIFCHPCALCQEGRELRRRLPHPGFSAKPVLFMMPPAEQNMGR
ncbi:cell number regulator 8-like [Lycium barbarum]|uniref:cell number regulator 8-like n=1 Tax=Lycium barbarum TaxID=112863 RepID=UPI00293EF911|nr:cell number regulator 8-like [Lycium barbarum]